MYIRYIRYIYVHVYIHNEVLINPKLIILYKAFNRVDNSYAVGKHTILVTCLLSRKDFGKFLR